MGWEDCGAVEVPLAGDGRLLSCRWGGLMICGRGRWWRCLTGWAIVVRARRWREDCICGRISTRIGIGSGRGENCCVDWRRWIHFEDDGDIELARRWTCRFGSVGCAIIAFEPDLVHKVSSGGLKNEFDRGESLRKGIDTNDADKLTYRDDVPFPLDTPTMPGACPTLEQKEEMRTFIEIQKSFDSALILHVILCNDRDDRIDEIKVAMLVRGKLEKIRVPEGHETRMIRRAC